MKNFREVVLKAILQVCSHRGWIAHIVHVRSNHIHIVVSGKEKPEKMMADFKAYSTRAIKKNSNKQAMFRKYWSQHGSTKYLWTKENLVSTVEYVKNRQGKTMSLWVGDLDRALSVIGCVAIACKAKFSWLSHQNCKLFLLRSHNEYLLRKLLLK